MNIHTYISSNAFLDYSVSLSNNPSSIPLTILVFHGLMPSPIVTFTYIVQGYICTYILSCPWVFYQHVL